MLKLENNLPFCLIWSCRSLVEFGNFILELENTYWPNFPVKVWNWRKLLEAIIRERIKEKVNFKLKEGTESNSLVGIISILKYLTIEYWNIAVAIFPSRQSVFPSELQSQSPQLGLYGSVYPLGAIRVRIGPPQEAQYEKTLGFLSRGSPNTRK